MSTDWWYSKPRTINIVVDNDSWILPYIPELTDKINAAGDKAYFYQNYEDVTPADISFYLSCIKITPQAVLTKSKKNLVIHASNLPEGRGFSPIAWQILEGKHVLPVCLIEMVEEVDAGPIVFKDELRLEGHELAEEIKKLQGENTIDLCLKYLASPHIPEGKPQQGTPSFYPRRRAKDSKLDTHKSIDDLFNLLRIVDNERYPAFFEKNGYKYVVHIFKEPLDK